MGRWLINRFPTVSLSVCRDIQRESQAAIVENKRLGPILAYIAEQQKQLDMSRAATAPRRRGQKNHMFKAG